MPDIERLIELNERCWAKSREYQRFLGTFISVDGLWFTADTTVQTRDRIVALFLRTPNRLQDLAREYRLTVSVTADKWTVSAHSSCIYGDWQQSDRTRVSPHLEIGAASMENDDILLAHLVHELGHLLFWNLSRERRLQFAEFLLHSTDADTVDVTPYVQGKLDDHRNGICGWNSFRGDCAWVKEAFPETIADFWVPAHPHRLSNCNVDVDARIAFIERLVR